MKRSAWISRDLFIGAFYQMGCRLEQAKKLDWKTAFQCLKRMFTLFLTYRSSCNTLFCFLVLQRNFLLASCLCYHMWVSSYRTRKVIIYIAASLSCLPYNSTRSWQQSLRWHTRKFGRERLLSGIHVTDSWAEENKKTMWRKVAYPCRCGQWVAFLLKKLAIDFVW